MSQSMPEQGPGTGPDSETNAEPKRVIAERDTELAGRDSRIAELEGVVAERDKEITALKGSLGGLEGSLSQTVSAYRSLIIKSTPGLPEELVTGDSVEAIDSSVASAQSLITKVKLGLEAELAGASVPAGAPPRRPVDLSALSPREKIQYAVGERR